MRTFGVIHFLFFIIAFLVCQCVQAQDFLVTTKGDTVAGKLKLLLFDAEKKVQVADASTAKTIYSIFQISSFRLKNETYKPVKGPTGFTFMKLLKEGYLSLLSFQPQNQVNYDGRYLLRKDGSGTEVPNLSFKKIMASFLSDCPSISAQIQSGELSKKDLEKIINGYNDCIEQKTIAQPVAQPASVVVDAQRISPWETLEQKVNGHEAFEGKENIQEMITEIKNKIYKQEKVPNFLLQGLKDGLTIPELQGDLNAAIQSLQ